MVEKKKPPKRRPKYAVDDRRQFLTMMSPKIIKAIKLAALDRNEPAWVLWRKPCRSGWSGTSRSEAFETSRKNDIANRRQILLVSLALLEPVEDRLFREQVYGLVLVQCGAFKFLDYFGQQIDQNLTAAVTAQPHGYSFFFRFCQLVSPCRSAPSADSHLSGVIHNTAHQRPKAQIASEFQFRTGPR